ncbi:hypothetical protein FOZ63_028095 [Perkinsus olseni]|uniref:Uncharacterized protein n=1 Tax=Perkinsus olseni TaxID=32597 RepID=A0A7J6REJ9_PEROL|nr:hypothetical protein FOZ63_028095 [Perkinsus olseni]
MPKRPSRSKPPQTKKPKLRQTNSGLLSAPENPAAPSTKPAAKPPIAKSSPLPKPSSPVSSLPSALIDATLDLPTASDYDSQTRAFVHQHPLHASIPTHDQPITTPLQPPSTDGPSIPGYLVADLPKSTSLSHFLDRDWPDFIPPSWRRIKHIDKAQPSSLTSLSAIIMSGLGLSSRLALSGVIHPITCVAFQGRLSDAAFGRDGTSRARFLLESALTELLSIVIEGRCPDYNLTTPCSRCLDIEQALSRFTGFTAPPPQPAFSKGGKGKGGKGNRFSSDSTPSTTHVQALTTTTAGLDNSVKPEPPHKAYP